MKKFLQYFNIIKKENHQTSTSFSRFFREASSAERKKVFLNVAKKATIDQQKVMSI